jgi:hypothetical protein
VTRASSQSKTTKRLKAASEEFAHEFGWAIVRLAKVPHRHAVRDLKGIERVYLKKLTGHPDCALEVRRRVAEQLLDLALVHDCRLSICRERLRRNAELGWSTFDRQFHFHLLYARGVLARGHVRTAEKVASCLLLELEGRLERLRGLPRQRGRKWLLDSIATVREVLDEVACAKTGVRNRTWNSGGRYIKRSK